MVDFAALSAPFPADRISWRVGSTTKDKARGMALAYIDARDVYDRLDQVCGPGGWQCRYPHADKKTVCEIGIKVGDEWIWKANGAGDSDVEAEKGALSDALKRAAVAWGIGRYLYDLDSPWVPLEAKGSSYVIAADGYAQLRRLLGGKSAASSNGRTPAFGVGNAGSTPAAATTDQARKLADLVYATTTGDDLSDLIKDPDFRSAYEGLDEQGRALVLGARDRQRAKLLAPMGAG